MHLAAQQERVDDGAEIVDDEVAHDLDLTGLRVDLDFADMATVRECRRRRREMAAFGKPGFEPGRQLGGVEGGASDGVDRDAAVRARDGKGPILEGDIGLRRLQHMRRGRPSFSEASWA